VRCISIVLTVRNSSWAISGFESPAAASSQQRGVLCYKVSPHDKDDLHAGNRAHRGRDHELGFSWGADATLDAKGSGLGRGGDRRDRVEEGHVASASLLRSFVPEGEGRQRSIPERRDTKLVVEGGSVGVTGNSLVDEGCTATRHTYDDISGSGGALGVPRLVNMR